MLFVLEQQREMPDYTKLGLFVFTFIFNIYSIIYFHKSFHRLILQDQYKLIQKWKKSHFSSFADFIRFFESLVVFDLYHSISLTHADI